MQYRLADNLGTIDARKCNADFGTHLNFAKLAKGEVVDLTEEAHEYLAKRYPKLLESTASVKGVAKAAEVTAPAKSEK